MADENKRTTDANLEGMEPAMKEFVRKPVSHKKKTQRKRQENYLFLCGFCLIPILGIILGVIVCQVPVLTLIAVMLLEILLSCFLIHSPIWLHGILVLFQLLLGFLFHFPLLLVIGAAVYLVDILILHHWGKH